MSGSAKACPKCGAPPKKKTSPVAWIGGGLLALIFIAYIAGSKPVSPVAEQQGVLAVLAAPLLASGDEVVFAHHAAMRARHSLAVAPAHFPEDLERLLFIHFKDAAHRQCAGFG